MQQSEPSTRICSTRNPQTKEGLFEMCESDIQRMAAIEVVDRPTKWAAIKGRGCKVDGVQAGYYFILKDQHMISLLPPVRGSAVKVIETENFEVKQPRISAYNQEEIVNQLRNPLMKIVIPDTEIARRGL